MPWRRFISLGLLLVMLAACSPRTTPQPTAKPVPPTATPIPATATPKPANQKLEMGFTPEGWPYRGNPEAPVTLWEFSDFQ